MKIGDLYFENKVFLAPMAGVTDIAFRGICKDMGCGLVYTEMISAKALYHGSENTKSLLRISDKEKPIAIQLFGNDPIIMANVCEKYLNQNDNICIIDINMGCPAPKIVKNGEGSALMKDPELASKIVKEMKRISKKPITVKFRKGFDSKNINALDFAKRMEQSGADAITIHGRTREQMYQGDADWDIIKNVKESVNIPVIGNGDVFTADDAISIFEYTKCDGVMVARGAMGNPWIFSQINSLIREEKVICPKDTDKIDMCIKHIKRAIYYNGEARAVREMRKHIAWYIKGMRNCTDIKNKINTENNSENVIEILNKYKEKLSQQ